MIHINQAQYEYACKRIEELLQVVQETTPATDPSAIELTIFSEVVIAYEKKHYPLTSINQNECDPCL